MGAEGGKEGKWVAQALRLTHITAVKSTMGSRHTQPLACMDVAVFELCMMMMDVDS